LALVIDWEQVLFNEDFWRAEKALVVAMAHPKDTHADKPQRRQKESACGWRRLLPITEYLSYLYRS